MRKFGLIGRDVAYSFSQKYFSDKFEKENITDASYQNFDIKDITEFPKILRNTKDICGFNVTIPYKEKIIPYLSHLNEDAKRIGAVNTIKITSEGELIGYNTDFYGFKMALEPYLEPNHSKALILGTGGASKAIAYALELLGIQYSFVSRNMDKGIDYTYRTLTHGIIANYPLIINCTPLGTFPNILSRPELHYQAITSNHLLFDLIYNPEETTFLKLGRAQEATALNGLKMLQLQAEKAWEIWNIL